MLIYDRASEKKALQALSHVERQAYVYAAWFHRYQVRKYVFTPHRYHLLEVAIKVKQEAGSEAQVLAAIFHDLVEDTYLKENGFWNVLLWLRKKTKFNFEDIDDVFVYVKALTDKYTSEAYPTLNRAERKLLEAYRLAEKGPLVQTIKYADLISNTETIVDYDPNFAWTYLREKLTYLRLATQGDSLLRAEAFYLVEKGLKRLAALQPKDND